MDETEYLNRRLGTTLRGKWTLERLLGAGGMAAVYVGVHRIGRRDAIKILHPEVAANPEVRGRFEQEAHAVNRLRHPGAVEVRDFDVTEDGCPFLVMELLEGEALSAVLERDAASLPQLLGWTEELLEVLAAAHDLGIIHRDIKPDNLFVQTDGHLKVLDFGIARMREGAPRAMVTRTGTALGTLSYMPPEQARGIHIDGRADLYSVGATLFRALGRKRIHDGASDADVLIKVATEAAPRLGSVAPHVPAAVCSVVDCALSFNREHRYPDARTMQADIRALSRNEAPPYVTANPPPAPVETSGGTLPASTPQPGSLGPDERTRAESSSARRPQSRSPAPMQPTPTRVEPTASPAPVPAVTLVDNPASGAPASQGMPMPPAPILVAAAAAMPIPRESQPVPAAKSSSVPLLLLLLGFGALVLLLAAIAGIGFWVHSSASGEDETAPETTATAPGGSRAGGGDESTPPSVATPTGTQRKTPPVTGTTTPVTTTGGPPGGTAVTPPGGTIGLIPPPTGTVATPPGGTTVPPPGTTAPPATTTPAPPAGTTATPPAATTAKPPDPGKGKKKGHEKDK